ncbi:MAG: tyrosine-type recombinase/integrase [Candidatus Arsenophonus phytopathogenicus]
MQLNPAELTKTPKIKIQRARLSLKDFNAILNFINDDNHWLTHAMKFALVTGQRVSDISKMKWQDIHDDKLWITQQKTGAKIAISLKVEIIGIKLSTILKINKNNSEYIINDSDKKVSIEKISKGFAKVRNQTKLLWDGVPPTFHEIRSLSARLYTEKMGGEFVRKLLGHKSAEMTAKYQDDRNDSCIEI